MISTLRRISIPSVIVSVEGNIGSGKSTFVENLRKKYSGKSLINESDTVEMNFVFVQEPVDSWMEIKDKDGKDMLSKFYEDQNKYSFAFQMMAYISRLSLLKKTYKENATNTIIVTERSVHTDRHVFAKMLYDNKNIEDVEYQIYLKWFEDFIEELPIFSTIYMRTLPEISHQRVEKRGREGESIPLAYLRQCHEYHESWLNQENNVFVMDVSGDATKENQDKWMDDFTGHLNRSLLTVVEKYQNSD